MRNNQPVTQREIEFPKHQYLVSKTDLKGVITFTNDAFVEISGFSREELIGASHNLVRHPDMPPAVFADMWATIKQGLPWRGLVKNRTKSGDFYWVQASIVPVRENNQLIGFMSVRSEASRAEVQAATAQYQRINQSTERYVVHHSFFQRFTIRQRLHAVLLFVAVMLLGSSAIGLIGIKHSNDALMRTYQTQLEPIDMIGRITQLMGDNRAQIMLSLQHNPEHAFAKMHDHPLAMHTDAILRNRDEITRLADALKARQMDAKLAESLETYRLAREVFVSEGLQPARQAMLDGKFDQANELLLKRLNPLYVKAIEHAKSLQDELKHIARDDFASAQAEYELIRNLSIGGGVLSLVLLALSGWGLSRAIVQPLERLTGHFEHISQGDLTEEIDISGRDETGLALASLSVMQVSLKVILDSVLSASKAIEDRSRQVQWQTAGVLDQSEQQRDKVQDVATATEEFSQSVNEVADSAESAATATDEAQKEVAAAQLSMNNSIVATNKVVDAVQESSATIADLDKAIAKIGAITQVIREIADQTNLLALNAAIEAARAGESGRGFAVVADEVRKLAERTSTSTSDISITVAEIRSVTDNAVSSMARAVSEVAHGNTMICESEAGLSRVTAVSDSVAVMAKGIAEAAREQAIAGNSVASNMERIAGLIEGNVEAARSAEAATHELLATADDLRTTVSRFRLAK